MARAKIQTVSTGDSNSIPVARAIGGGEQAAAAGVAGATIDLRAYGVVRFHSTSIVKIKQGPAGVAVSGADYDFVLQPGQVLDTAVMTDSEGYFKVWGVGNGQVYFNGWK